MVAALSAKAEEHLNIFVWSGTISPEVIKEFEQKTGISVTVNQYDSDDTAEAKLLTGEAGFDLMSITLAPYFIRQSKLNLFHRLDWTEIPNAKFMDPDLLSVLKIHNVDLEAGIPYMWGTIGFGFNRQKIEKIFPDGAPTDSLKMLYDPEVVKPLAQCGVYILESPQEVFFTILQYLKSLGALKNLAFTEANLQMAQEQLAKVQPYVAHFESFSDRIIDVLFNEEGCVVQCYSPDCLRAQAEVKAAGKDFEIIYTTPKEGASLWVDMLTIPKNAPNPKNAMKFINFLLDPKIAAENSRQTYQATSVKAALAFLPEEYQKNPHFYPSPDMISKLYIMENLPFRQEKLITRAWYKARLGV